MSLPEGKKFVQVNIRKFLIWKHHVLFYYFYHNFLHRCPSELILVATERRLKYLQLFSLPQIQEKKYFWRLNVGWKLTKKKTPKIKGFTS